MPLTSSDKKRLQDYFLSLITSGKDEDLTSLSGYLDRYQSLFKAKQLDINFCTDESFNALFNLVLRGELELVRKLIDLGANHLSKGPFGSSLAHAAVAAPEDIAFDALKYCLSLEGISITDTNPKGRTLLHSSVSNPDMVSFLVRFIDPNTPDNNGLTPLHIACSGLRDESYGVSSESIEILIKAGGKRVADKFGKMPEEYAIYEDLSDVDTALRIIQEASSSKTEVAALGEASLATEGDKEF